MSQNWFLIILIICQAHTHMCVCVCVSVCMCVFFYRDKKYIYVSSGQDAGPGLSDSFINTDFKISSFTGLWFPAGPLSGITSRGENIAVALPSAGRSYCFFFFNGRCYYFQHVFSLSNRVRCCFRSSTSAAKQLTGLQAVPEESIESKAISSLLHIIPKRGHTKNTCSASSITPRQDGNSGESWCLKR